MKLTPAFSLRVDGKPVDFVVLSVADFVGESVDPPHANKFMTEESCAQWSANNLKGQRIKLCQSGDFSQHQQMLPGLPGLPNVVWAAMEPLSDIYGCFICKIEYGSVSRYYTPWMVRWQLSRLFIFRLCEVE